MQPESHVADYFVGSLIAGTIAWDLWAPETASNAIRRHSERPWQKFMLAGFMGALTLHLCDLYEINGLPDPFKIALERTRHETNKAN